MNLFRVTLPERVFQVSSSGATVWAGPRAKMDYDSAGIRYELPKKPKFEKDFIMLSEFSELVGPVPVVSGSEHSRGWD